MEAQGFFHLEYDEEERPKLYINITSARIPTGKPSDKEYTERCLALKNPVISVYGTVVAIPIETGDRIFTLEVSTYLRREAGRNIFSNFEISE